MPCSKDYWRKCEKCNFVGKTASNWSKHLKTKKHQLAVENEKLKQQNDKYKIMELELQLAQLKQQQTTTTINNTQNNTYIDNSVNIFTPNPEANCLSDIVIPTLKEMAEQEIIPSVAIQKIIMAMEERVRPILYHKNILFVKQDEWKRDDEAEKELTKFCNEKYAVLNDEFLNMDMTLDSVLYDRCMEYAIAVPLDKDTITHKLKTKLIQQ